MNTNRLLTVLCAATLMTTVAACQRDPAPDAVSNGQPSQTVVQAGPVLAQGTFRDPSLPDAASVFAAQDAADKAKVTLALEQAATPQQVATPQQEMTKAEESKAMPLPSQANDHSTTALDKTRVN